MEAIAAHAVLVVVFVRHGIEIGLRWHGAMERGVENGGHRDAGKHFFHGVDALQAARVVQRSEIAKVFDALDDLVVDEDALGELLATVGYAVTNGVDFLQVFDDAHLRVDQSLQHQLNAFGVVRDGELFIVFLAIIFMGEFAHFEADALQEAFGQQA